MEDLLTFFLICCILAVLPIIVIVVFLSICFVGIVFRNFKK